MKKHFLSIIVVLISAFMGFSQNVKITGKADNGENKKIQLITHADRISMLEKTLDECVIDEETKAFTLKTSINYPTLVYLQIENYSQGFFIEPNQNYEVIIPKFDWEKDEYINPYIHPQALTVVFKNLPENNLNYLIHTFDSVYDDNIGKYRYALLFDFKKQILDTIKREIDSIFERQKHPYFLQYKQYKIAELELMTHYKSRKVLAEELLYNKPILYNHIGYMDFFSTFFEKYFINGIKQIPFQSIDYWIIENKYFTLLDSLGVDTLLKNEVLREMVFLKGMNEAMYSTYYSPASVAHILQTFISETRFEAHKKIAENIIKQSTICYLFPSDPKFVLPNVEKQPVSVEKFKGKWVYLAFVRVKDPASIIELETMAHYRDTLYNNYKMEFVTISCDREFLKMYHFIESNKKNLKYNWTWLHFDNNFKLLDEYQIKDFPSFVIIDPKGKVYSSPAKTPGEGIFTDLHWLEENKAKDQEEYHFPR